MRTVRFGLLMGERERLALELLARTEGEFSRAAIIRRLIREEAKRRGLIPPAVLDEEVTDDGGHYKA